MRRKYKTKEWKYKKHQQYVMRNTLKKHRNKMRVPTRHKRTVPYQRTGKEQKKNIFVLKQLLEYHVFFGDDADNICIVDILKQIPREMLFNFVGVLNNIYGDATLDKLDLFFSSKSSFSANTATQSSKSPII